METGKNIYNESEWIRLLFLLSDMQQWMREMEQQLFMQLPLENKKKLFRSSYYVTATALVHILERHYYKISRHPGCGKFNIDIADILHWIKEAFHEPALPLPSSANYYRCFNTGACIGYDKAGNATCFITVLSSPNGQVVTAFPGELAA